MRLLGAAALTVCCAGAASAQQLEKPRLEPARVIGETVIGGYASIGGFFLGRYAFSRGGSLLGIDDETTLRRVGNVGGVLTAGAATAGVVYGIGSIGNQTGDFDATSIGTGIGMVVALGTARAVLGPAERPRAGMSTRTRWAAVSAIAMLPAIGATIGFNSTLRYK